MERPSWGKSFFGQFRLGWKIYGPPWFYLSLIGILACLDGGDRPAGLLAGGLILLASLACAVQETRRRHGTDLPNIGWWTVAGALSILAGGLIYMAEGVLRQQMMTFALGLIVVVVTVFVVLFLTVLRRKEGKDGGGEKGFLRALIGLLAFALLCLAAFLLLSWRVQVLEAELVRLCGDGPVLARLTDESVREVYYALHGRGGLYTWQGYAGAGLLGSVFGLFVWGVERFRRAIGK